MNKTNRRTETPMPRAPQICEKQIKTLNRHPKFDEIYGALAANSSAVRKLVERYDEGMSLGVPVVAHIPETDGYIILRGSADVAAAEVVGLKKLPVQVVECTSSADALKRLIESNQALAKSLLDVAMEVYHLDRAQRKLAKERQRRAGGDRRSAAAKEGADGGSVPSESDGGVRGETRNIVAKITRQSRERVTLMVELISKALSKDKTNPRASKIGRALAERDADLKTVAMKFDIIKSARATPTVADDSESRPTPAAKSMTPAAKSTTPAAKSTTPAAKSTTPAAKSTTSTSRARLLAAADHLAVLENDVKVLSASSLARATKRGRRVALLRALASALTDAGHRLLVTTGGVDMKIPGKVIKRGPAAIRDFLLQRIVSKSKALRSDLAKELGPKDAHIVKDLRGGTRELEPTEGLAVIRALLTCLPSKP